MQFCICRDDDGHYYVIEKAKETDFYKWLDDIALDRYISDYNFEYDRVGGLHTITFDRWEEV